MLHPNETILIDQSNGEQTRECDMLIEVALQIDYRNGGGYKRIEAVEAQMTRQKQHFNSLPRN